MNCDQFSSRSTQQIIPLCAHGFASVQMVLPILFPSLNSPSSRVISVPKPLPCPYPMHKAIKRSPGLRVPREEIERNSWCPQMPEPVRHWEDMIEVELVKCASAIHSAYKSKNSILAPCRKDSKNIQLCW